MEQAIIKTMKTSLFMDDINEIDFTMVKLKLQDAEEGLGWTKQQCEDAEIEYKKFLVLKRAYPEREIVPNKTVDLFWHQHILDTVKYAEDCEVLFGFFIHHYPYFGMNGKEDAQNLVDAFDETKVLFKRHFNEDYLGDAPKCTTPKCRTACKPQKCR
jgi:hypothetical protein